MKGINIFSEIFLDLEILRHMQVNDTFLRDCLIDEMVENVEYLIKQLTDDKERAKATAAAHEYRKREENEVLGI